MKQKRTQRKNLDEEQKEYVTLQFSREVKVKAHNVVNENGKKLFLSQHHNSARTFSPN